MAMPFALGFPKRLVVCLFETTKLLTDSKQVGFEWRLPKRSYRFLLVLPSTHGHDNDCNDNVSDKLFLEGQDQTRSDQI